MSSTDNSETRNTEPSVSLNVDAIWVRSASLAGILFLLVMYTLYLAAPLVMPIVLGFLLSLVLSPVVRSMVKLRVPQTLSALLVMLSVVAVIAAAGYALAAPASEWMEKAPTELRRLEYKLAWVKEPIQKIQEAQRQVEEMTETQPGDTQKVRDGSSFSLVDTFLGFTPDLLFGLAVTLILLFFVLASGDAFLNKMVQVTPRLHDKKRVVAAARDIQRHISIYLGTITLINIAVGAIIALLMYLLDMPNPLLWGAMVAVLNYIPYLGVGFSMLVVTFVSLLTFDSVNQILLPPLAIFMVNVIEGQILTPMIAGRQLSLSPIAVFLSLVVLGWIWGVIGVLIAVPILATVKLVCEQVEPLENIATFLDKG